MITVWQPTIDLRWNAGVLEQKFIAENPGPEYGKSEWRDVPDVLPRRDEVVQEATGHADLSTFPNAAPGAFYEFTINGPNGEAVHLRSTAPAQIEDESGVWRKVFCTRKPEPLPEVDLLTYETVAEILRSHSSPTMGAPGSVHGGQRGFIVYEADGLPFIVSQLAELATLDDGRTAKDMLHKQGSEIRRLEILADYQREELTRLEDMARLGLCDNPAAGATLAAVMKERDELRASLPNFESQVAELMAAFDEALADMRRERDELREKLRRAHALDDSNQADAARARAALREQSEKACAQLKTAREAVSRGARVEQQLRERLGEIVDLADSGNRNIGR